MAEPKGFLVVPVGYNPSDDLRALELDADDALKIAFSAAAKGLVGGHGWIGGAWQKNPLLLGYSGVVNVAWNSTTLPAGTSNVDAAVVPDGEIWMITTLTGLILSATITAFYIGKVVSGGFYPVQYQATPGNNINYPLVSSLILAPGENLRGRVLGATLNDDLYCSALGYRIDIDQ